MSEKKLEGRDIASTYGLLIETCNQIGMTNDEIQKQLTVYGGAPFQVHSRSWGVNEVGEIECFHNNRNHVAIRLDDQYTKGTIHRDEYWNPETGLILLSDNRTNEERMEGFKPKPEGDYPISEAFQIMEGDYTLLWKQEERMFFQNGYRWDFRKIFSDHSFCLSEYTDTNKFEEYTRRVEKLSSIVSKNNFLTPRQTHDFLVSREETQSLGFLIDCGLLRYYDGNFASALFDKKYPLKEHALDGQRFEL